MLPEDYYVDKLMPYFKKVNVPKCEDYNKYCMMEEVVKNFDKRKYNLDIIPDELITDLDRQAVQFL